MSKTKQSSTRIVLDQIDEKKAYLNSTQERWQIALSEAITDPSQLYNRLQLDTTNLDQKLIEGAELASEHFRVFATESYLKRIEPGNWRDPLLLQILPKPQETISQIGYSLDPLEEEKSTPIPGLLHKYRSRVLIITNSHCAINCRFCFRKNFPYSSNHYSSENKEAIEEYLREHTEVSEVILSGGDPLLLNDRRLAELIALISNVKHIKTLRIHSRIPIVLPERITTKLLSILGETRLKVIMVIHCNHAQEINTEVSETLSRLSKVCFRLLNQSVLLKGINDSIEVLTALQQTLFEEGVQSYYLHLLDKVDGTAHFDLPSNTAIGLYHALQANLSGYMVPKLVREDPNKPNKTQITGV